MPRTSHKQEVETRNVGLRRAWWRFAAADAVFSSVHSEILSSASQICTSFSPWNCMCPSWFSTHRVSQSLWRDFPPSFSLRTLCLFAGAFAKATMVFIVPEAFRQLVTLDDFSKELFKTWLLQGQRRAWIATFINSWHAPFISDAITEQLSVPIPIKYCKSKSNLLHKSMTICASVTPVKRRSFPSTSSTSECQSTHHKMWWNLLWNLCSSSSEVTSCFYISLFWLCFLFIVEIRFALFIWLTTWKYFVLCTYLCVLHDRKVDFSALAISLLVGIRCTLLGLLSAEFLFSISLNKTLYL